MRKLINCLCITATFCFFYACASQATLTGGPKDVTPPQIVKSEPETGTTSFSENRIIITFNEFFSLNAPNDSILINPPLSKKPVFTIKGKKLQIDFKEELKANTTYSISLNGAILDITEGNRLLQQDIIFSTGGQTDSCYLAGYVYDAFTHEPQKNACILLYSMANDSNPIRNNPDYFTLTNNNGFFLFNHLPNKPFQLFAVEDHNKNRLYDLPDEKIAFLPANTLVQPIPLPDNCNMSETADGENRPDTLNITDTPATEETQYKLFLFQEKEQKIKILKKSELYSGCFLIQFNLPVDTFALTSLQQSPAPCVIIKSNNKDSIFIFPTDSTIQTKRNWIVWANGEITDTVSLQPAITPTGKAASTGLKLSATDKVEIDSQFRISVNYPIQSIDTSAFTLTVTDDSNDTLVIEHVPLKIYPLYLKLDYPLHPKKIYQLFAPDSICQSYNGLFNDSIRFKFSIKGKKEYGNILFHIQFPEKGNYIIQLTNSQKDKILYEQMVSQEDLTSGLQMDIHFKNIKENSYRLRVIRDTNGNGIWDTGLYNELKHAESLFYSNQTWEVKKKWTIEENIEIEFE